MNRAWTIGLAIVVAAIGCSSAGAHSPQRAAGVRPQALPVATILDTVREMGLAPNRQTVRRGPYYVLHAVDLRGIERRIVADAYFGDILSITPAWPYSYVPYYVRAPHIIQVPEPGAAKPAK
jgi:hypothetical protein